jgi:hypothetical protein
MPAFRASGSVDQASTCAKQGVEVDLRLSLLIASDVSVNP